MEFPETSASEYLSFHSLSPENTVGFLPHSQGASSQPFISSKDPVEIMELQAPSLSQNTSPIANSLNGERTTVKISWNHGGNQVALVGSWDNWETREIMQRMGARFQVLKTLPSGIYHYRFVVDGWLVCAPDLPWVSDDSGNPYNILDLPENESEMLESLSEFERPPSPELSYDNQILNEDDFSKPPPELPPQLRTTVLNGQSPSDDDQLRPMALHTELNHLYVQRNNEENMWILFGCLSFGGNCCCCCAEQGCTEEESSFDSLSSLSLLLSVKTCVSKQPSFGISQKSSNHSLSSKFKKLTVLVLHLLL